jgi:hypothetical protein
MPLHDKLDVPVVDNAILVGFNEQESPGGMDRTDNATVPVKPLRLVKVIVEMPVLPELM